MGILTGMVGNQDFLKADAPLPHQRPSGQVLATKDINFESQTVQASKCKRSRDYKEATASAEALIARQLNTRPWWATRNKVIHRL